MGRVGDFGWWLREHVGGFALVLALLGCGAGAAGVVLALDARDSAENANAAIAELATLAASTASTTPVAPDTEVQATVDELNERVAQIEESVSQLRTEGSTAETTTPEDTVPPDTSPDVPKLPGGLPDLPGVGDPETEIPPEALPEK